jgi:hypothetical protein
VVWVSEIRLVMGNVGAGAVSACFGLEEQPAIITVITAKKSDFIELYLKLKL